MAGPVSSKVTSYVSAAITGLGVIVTALSALTPVASILPGHAGVYVGAAITIFGAFKQALSDSVLPAVQSLPLDNNTKPQ